MKYVDEYRNTKEIKELSRLINRISLKKSVKIMELCGTHTHNFLRFGLDKVIPENIELIAGPGCPVCVSSRKFIDAAIELSRQKNTIIVTFGDMLRIPGSSSSLEKERAKGSIIKVVYSPLDTIKIAKNNPEKIIVFLAVGFETTAPAIGLTILQAKKEKIRNIFFFSSLKSIPRALESLIKDKLSKFDALLLPGHVSSVIGLKSYEKLLKGNPVASCVTGFEPVDILEGIYYLLKQISDKIAKVENQYARAVRYNGNLKAQHIINDVFILRDDTWRGLGTIKASGFGIRKSFRDFDAEVKFKNVLLSVKDSKFNNKCRCGEVLRGIIKPKACKLFKTVCNPQNPLGPCMVSNEGACNAYFKYA